MIPFFTCYFLSFTVLRETGLGKSFFGGVAQPEPLRNILRQVGVPHHRPLMTFALFWSSYSSIQHHLPHLIPCPSLNFFFLALYGALQAYGDPLSVDDETLDFILQPGLLDGAADVFLDFISYRSAEHGRLQTNGYNVISYHIVTYAPILQDSTSLL